MKKKENLQEVVSKVDEFYQFLTDSEKKILKKSYAMFAGMGQNYLRAALMGNFAFGLLNSLLSAKETEDVQAELKMIRKEMDNI